MVSTKHPALQDAGFRFGPSAEAAPVPPPPIDPVRIPAFAAGVLGVVDLPAELPAIYTSRWSAGEQDHPHTALRVCSGHGAVQSIHRLYSQSVEPTNLCYAGYRGGDEITAVRNVRNQRAKHWAKLGEGAEITRAWEFGEMTLTRLV